ncbi:MAG: Nif3-like dinuclear metal center hexameric protein [Bdellovibrionales bacterium]|nr:Nif3-like dinuclear metal center hexameric protein [Bdellovibrionales bacterium]
MTKTRRTSPSLSGILADLEKRTPAATAMKWDNVGLLVGDSRAKAKLGGAVVSIDLTAESVATAKRLGYRLIVNHHPCIFPSSKGLARVTASGASALVFEAARAGIAVVATHTNFDVSALEVPAAVSKALGFAPIGRLFDEPEASFTKLVVFVPKTHVEKVRDAICAAGAGKIGRYDTCTFGLEGEGTFRGGEGTRPFLGVQGKLERAREVRLETVFPRGLKKRVLAAMRESHPYEEIAYDLYRVEQEPGAVGLVSGLGMGVYGDFPKPVPYAEVLRRVKRAFGVRGFLQTEPAPKTVKRIGFVPGKGSSFVRGAGLAGCDLFITGEAGYHVARESALNGVAIMELGHRESEVFFLRTVEGWCREWGLRAKVLNTPIQSVRT